MKQIVKLLTLVFYISAYEDVDEIMDKLAGVETAAINADLARLKEIADRKAPDLKPDIISLQKKLEEQKRRELINQVMTKDHKYLIAKFDQLPAQAKEEIKSGRAKFADKVLYHTTVESTAIGSIYEIIKADSTLGTGYSNLDKGGKVPVNVNIVVDYVKLLFNEHADGKPFETAFIAASSNAKLSNCDFEMLVNNEVVLSVPVQAMTESRVVKSDSADNIHGGINLKQRILLRESDKVQFRIVTPDGVTIEPATNKDLAVRAMVYGVATSLK